MTERGTGSCNRSTIGSDRPNKPNASVATAVLHCFQFLLPSIKRICLRHATNLWPFAFVITLLLPGFSQAQDQIESSIFTLKHYMYSGATSSYRIDIFPEGKVVYEGTGQVRVKGFKVFRISKDQIAALFSALRNERFFDSQGGGETGSSKVSLYPRTTTIVAHQDGMQRQITYFTHPPSISRFRLLAVIESIAPTKSLRCPFWRGSDPSKPTKNDVEVCSAQESTARYFIENARLFEGNEK